MPLTIGSSKQELLAALLAKQAGYPAPNLSEAELLLALSQIGKPLSNFAAPSLILQAPLAAAENARALTLTGTSVSTAPALCQDSWLDWAIRADATNAKIVAGVAADWSALHNPGAVGYYVGISYQIAAGTTGLIPLVSTNNGNQSIPGFHIYGNSVGLALTYMISNAGASVTHTIPGVFVIGSWQKIVFHVTSSQSTLYLAPDAPASIGALSLAYSAAATNAALVALNWSTTHTAAAVGTKLSRMIITPGAHTPENTASVFGAL
jgi:hypothetical protein